MKVRDVMTRGVATIDGRASLGEVVEKMLAAGVGALPVVDGERRLVGIVTEADVMSAQAAPASWRRGRQSRRYRRKAGARTATELMTEAIVATPDEDLRVAIRRMLSAGIRRLPVVDDERRVVGIVSRRDGLRMYAQSGPALRDAVRRRLDEIGYVVPDFEVTAEVSRGVVRLSGVVTYSSTVRRVEREVRAIPGVIDVDNRLVSTFEVAKPPAVESQAR